MFARMLPQVAEPRKIPIRNKTASCPLVIVNSKRANNARNSVIVIGFKNVNVFSTQVHSTLKSLHIYGSILSLRCHHDGNILKCKNIGLRAMYI